ncbi:hypothetical protein PRZ48_009396 [Zasmidium cellare]|uniref:Uncharacterized protein n=1 Tax=Zasmidium cellare TaxID=395010 RepID=A0ABR0EBM1_ZASCE|nr:hypothetical protein PRZ48_009396 [Zasmidium cellare]
MATNDSADIADDSSDLQRHIFPFFALPQELRDEIYDQHLTSYAGKLKCGFKIVASDIPITNLLLVSKAFGEEYRLRVRKKSQVTITDTNTWGAAQITIIPPPVANARRLKIEVACFSWDEVERHGQWVGDVVKRVNHPLVLQIHVNYCSQFGFHARRNMFMRWVQWKGLTELKIHKKQRKKDAWDFMDEDGLQLEWLTDIGDFENVTDKKMMAGGN